ncbi:hypothetical protein AB0I84_47220 [Streptomyces spectabilis]|uniref:hypothetical protein n=1 Tax=Streptomyces spectabilis TaxID=68270 RepID=UPI0033EA1872
MRVEHFPVLVTARPDDDEYAPTGTDPRAARILRAREVRAGDVILAAIVPSPTGLARTRYETEAYPAAPADYDPACPCDVCYLAADEPEGTVLVLSAGYPWLAHDPWRRDDLALVVPAPHRHGRSLTRRPCPPTRTAACKGACLMTTATVRRDSRRTRRAARATERTARRAHLLVLLARADRGVLTPEDSVALRAAVETEVAEGDTFRRSAGGQQVAAQRLHHTLAAADACLVETETDRDRYAARLARVEQLVDVLAARPPVVEQQLVDDIRRACAGEAEAMQDVDATGCR